MGALFGGGGGQAAPIQQQVGITNEEAQAQSAADSRARFKSRQARRKSLATAARSLSNEDDRLLS